MKKTALETFEEKLRSIYRVRVLAVRNDIETLHFNTSLSALKDSGTSFIFTYSTVNSD